MLEQSSINEKRSITIKCSKHDLENKLHLEMLSILQTTKCRILERMKSHMNIITIVYFVSTNDAKIYNICMILIIKETETTNLYDNFMEFSFYNEN